MHMNIYEFNILRHLNFHIGTLHSYCICFKQTIRTYWRRWTPLSTLYKGVKKTVDIPLYPLQRRQGAWYTLIFSPLVHHKSFLYQSNSRISWKLQLDAIVWFIFPLLANRLCLLRSFYHRGDNKNSQFQRLCANFPVHLHWV